MNSSRELLSNHKTWILHKTVFYKEFLLYTQLCPALTKVIYTQPSSAASPACKGIAEFIYEIKTGFPGS